MYCPSCGRENSEHQRFCRSCGLKLKMISAVLTNEPPAAERDDASIDISRLLRKGWQNPQAYGFLVIVLGLIIIIFGKTIFLDKTFSDIGATISLIGGGLIGLKGLMLLAPRWFSSSPKAIAREESILDLPPKQLSGEPPSITEHTTKHLDASLQPRDESSRDTQPTNAG
jgi:hypothetical protein